MQTNNLNLDKLVSILAGRSNNRTIFCAADISGSIGNSQWKRWLKIINHLYEQTICPWNFLTFNHLCVHVGVTPKSLPKQLPGSGGSSLEPVFKIFVQESQSDTLLIFTDGDVCDYYNANEYVETGHICVDNVLYVVPSTRSTNIPGSHSCNTFDENNLVVPEVKKEPYIAPHELHAGVSYVPGCMCNFCRGQQEVKEKKVSGCPCELCNPTKDQEQVKEKKIYEKTKPRFIVVELGNFYDLSTKDLQQALNDKIPVGYSVKDVNCIPQGPSTFIPKLQWVAICEVKES